ncbi:hypothetical protein E6H11_03270 [Candidatus Bathyarchaeota archaeon]|nr:MAG: hypothetical protein E6H11_03270 [Candidatus Bathyarchaeota archaeon]
MRRRASIIIVTLFFILLIAALSPREAHASALAPNVNRSFYFSGASHPNASIPGSLSSSPLTGPVISDNLSRVPTFFVLPSFLLSSLTVSGLPTFTIWLSGNASSVTSVQVQGVFSWKPLNGLWSNSSTLPVPCPIGRSPAACTLNYVQPLALSLTFGTQVRVGINATTPAKMIVTMYWGEPSTPSFVLLPLSGYSSIGPVQILDWTGNAAASFNLNATKGQNTVLVQAPVTSAFGKDDVRSVNLTIVDPSGRPVPNAVNIPFSQIPPVSQPQQTYPYVAEWTYPSNLSEGNYQVWIDVVDIQGNIAYSLHGPSGFGLFKPGIHPLDLIPYVVGAAGGIIAGTFYIKRRRRKEYLAPFDHFYSLTGGSFPQGTMVTVEGNTGAGKTLLTEQLMYDDLKRGRPCVFVSTADFPGKIRSGMRSLGLETEPYESKESLKFVDSYSMEAGQPSQEKFYVSSSGDLTSLGVKISSAMSTPGDGASVYFDSLTPLAPRSKSESIVSFAQTVGAKARGSGGKIFFTIGSSVDDLILRQLEEASDCIIQMEAFEEGGLRRRRMRIIKFRNRSFHEGWVTFTVEDNKGIIFYSKKPRK